MERWKLQIRTWDTFGLLKSESVTPNFVDSLGMVGISEEVFDGDTNVERLELPVSVRQVLFRFICGDRAPCKNQFCSMSDFETLEWYWEAVSNPHSPRLKKVTPPSPFFSPFHKDRDENSIDIFQAESKALLLSWSSTGDEKEETGVPFFIFTRVEDSKSVRWLNYLFFYQPWWPTSTIPNIQQSRPFCIVLKTTARVISILRKRNNIKAITPSLTAERKKIQPLRHVRQQVDVSEIRKQTSKKSRAWN